MKLSVVSPVYRAQAIVAELVAQIKAALEPLTTDYEIVLVNDHSPDASWDAIVAQCALDKRVKGIDLSRNFGQHYAITAGLRYATGDWVVVMDCDLQDRPDQIPILYAKALEGYDVVLAQRVERTDGFFKRLSSTLFHRTFRWLSGIKSDKAVANFGIYHRKVIEAYNQMADVARSFPSLIQFLGFPTAKVQVRHSERFEGKSSYSLGRLLHLTFDVVVANSNKPLRLGVGLGFAMSFVSFLLAIYNVAAHWLGFIKVDGFTTTVFSIWFVGGMTLFVLGILGLYIGKIFDQVKSRPLFVVRQTLNIE